MKHITLTDQEANRLDTYFILTGKRITEELVIWKQMQGKAPAAESNLKFWKEMQDLITKISNDLRG